MELADQYGIISVRATLSDIARDGTVDPEGILRIRGREIGLVYYRTGYQQDQHQTNQQDDPVKWGAREMLELSMAIKCPSVDMHLAGFKKYQQAMSDERLLQKFYGSEPSNSLVDLFKGIWSLENFD